MKRKSSRIYSVILSMAVTAASLSLNNMGGIAEGSLTATKHSNTVPAYTEPNLPIATQALESTAVAVTQLPPQPSCSIVSEELLQDTEAPLVEAEETDSEQSPFSYTIGEDGAVITGYTGTDTDVVIPDTIEETPVVEIGSNAFYRKDTITSIRIPETVTTIGYRAFRDCDSLKEITIPDAVVNIGDEAFCSCNNLVTVHLSQSLVTLGKSAFYECSSLLGIELPNTTESIGDACFYNCDALTRIILPEGITIGDSAFQYCDALEYLSLRNKLHWESMHFIIVQN